MNALTELAQHFRQIPVAELIVSTTHVQSARRRRYVDQALDELAASIKQSGVLQPILVRPFSEPHVVRTSDGASPAFEIVAGERRFLASQRAGLAEVPAIVRDLSEAEVLEAQLVENVQRETLDPLSEAEGYRELMQLKGITADQLGEIVGKSRSAVFARLKLLQLGTEGRAAVEQGKLDPSRALLVARIPDPKQQAIALKLALAEDWRGNPQYSYRDLLQEIGKKGATVSLAGAPFRLTDETLLPGSAPACMACPHITANALTDIPTDSADVCTRPTCYKAKLKAYTQRRTQDAIAAGETIIIGEAAKKIAPQKGTLVGYVDLAAPCDHDHFPEKSPVDRGQPEYEAELQAWQRREHAWRPRTYRELIGDAGCTVVLLEDPKSGLIRELVAVDEARKALKAIDIQLPTWAVPTKAPTPPRSPSDYAAERARDEKKHEEEKAYRRRIFDAVFPKALGRITHEETVALATETANDWTVKNFLTPIYGAKLKTIGSWSAEEIGRLLRIAGAVHEVISYYGQPTELLALAKAHKVDVGALRKSHADAPKPPAKKAAAKKQGTKKAAGKKTPAKKTAAK